MKNIVVALLACVFALTVTLLVLPGHALASTGANAPVVGANCTIQFRRDALGAASSGPVPPLTDNHNGADTCLAGKLKSLNSEWVVIEHGTEDLWIARSVVLLIRASHPGTP